MRKSSGVGGENVDEDDTRGKNTAPFFKYETLLNNISNLCKGDTEKMSILAVETWVSMSILKQTSKQGRS